MRKSESRWKEYCVMTPSGTRAGFVPLACFAAIYVLYLTVMVPLKIKFIPTLDVTQSISLYK